MNYKNIIQKLMFGYVGFLIIIFIFQGVFIYHPTQMTEYNDETLKNINAIKISNDNLEWLYLPAEVTTTKTLIYFHGNAGTAIDRAWKASFWRKNRFNVVLAEYYGYGTNEGTVNEYAFYMAGRVIIDKLLSDFPNTQLYIYGESIGSGTAVQMATEYKEIALIIESGFSSLGDVAFSKLPIIPVSLMLKDQYANASKINTINSRLVWMHGARDSVVPIRFGQKLFDTYKGEKDFRIFDGAGHNDIYTKTDINAVIRDLKL